MGLDKRAEGPIHLYTARRWDGLSALGLDMMPIPWGVAPGWYDSGPLALFGSCSFHALGRFETRVLPKVKAASNPEHYPQVGEAFFNPEGIVSSSPGLRGTSYPG